ncbi:MAG: hypothetical protein BWY99_01696 [Synergistetes bacterium ADurb.BinA166]|nr:MAG: hypothetical protein BWY99_01696 [Synergistetes bacterium ADurb.BinA166]
MLPSPVASTSTLPTAPTGAPPQSSSLNVTRVGVTASAAALILAAVKDASSNRTWTSPGSREDPLSFHSFSSSL